MKNLLIAIGLVGVVLLFIKGGGFDRTGCTPSHLRIGEELPVAGRQRQYRYLQHLKFNRSTSSR